MTTRLEFLSENIVFKGLTEDELDGLSHIAQEYTFDEKSVLGFQRDLADSMYLVKEGRLFVQRVDENGVVRETRSLLPGDFFGMEWLFFPGTFPATLKGRSEGRVLIIKAADFLDFLSHYRNALNHLEPVFEFDENGEEQRVQGFPEEVWNEASKLSLREQRTRIGVISLLPDELVEYYSRRSRYFLLILEFVPLLMMLAGFIGMGLGWFFLDNRTWQYVAAGVGGLVVLLGTAMALFRFFDWRNDYFVITNKHISAREFDLRSFRTELIKVPVSEVQSVEILKPNFTSNLFNIGTARITTASTRGTIFFDNIDDPIEVKNTLNRLTNRAQAIETGMTQTKMRRSLENYFGMDASYEAVDDPDSPAKGTAYYEHSKRRGEGFWRGIRDLFQYREEVGGVITYRKNFFVLFQDILWPSIVVVVLLLIGYGLVRFANMPNLTVLAIVGPLFALNLLWFAWGIEDWRNDTFQLTDQFVVDIDRKPFGFGESRKQAALSNIQNINAERPGFFSTIFNYGNVTIETAGADANLVFDGVPEPSVVQSEIFDRLDNVRKNQRMREGAARREEYAVLLDVYKQELEQERIPRRTPPSDYEELEELE